MRPRIRVSNVELDNYKAFKQFSFKIEHMNIVVGPNNCGKSTLLSTFKILELGLRYAKSKNPQLIRTPFGNKLGYYLNPDAMPVPLDNIHTNVDDIDTTVTFTLNNRNKLILYFPKSEQACNLLYDAQGLTILKPSQFKEHFPIDIKVVPTLGPVAYEEAVVSEETVRKGLSSHLASKHFRRYWQLYPDDFDKFAQLVNETWPGMEVTLPEVNGNKMFMLCLENRRARELYWSGFGFQVWCQLLTQIFRCSDSTMLIVDEPEIFLHPDVQRQLISILRDSGPDILLATHSTEVLGEADATEIVLIDKEMNKPLRLRNLGGIQSVYDKIGSLHNITLTQIARSRKIVFVEGSDDYNIVRRYAKKTGHNGLANGIGLTSINIGGFSFWESIKSISKSFKEILDYKLNICLILDRDFWPVEEIEFIFNELSSHIDLLHIHEQKEIENYLLNPGVLDRAIIKQIHDRDNRLGTKTAIRSTTIEILMSLSDGMKLDTLSQYQARKIDFFRNSGIDSATVANQVLQWFETRWYDPLERLKILPGKIILRKLNEYLQDEYKINLTLYRIIDEFKQEEIPDDLLSLIDNLEKFRIG